MTTEELLKLLNDEKQLATGVLENLPKIPGGQEFLENANKAYFDEKVGSYTSDIYNKLDNDIFEVTGLRKEANEKSYDFQKRILADLKKKAEDNSSNTPEEIKKYKDQIKELEEKVKNGESSSHWKESFEEVVQKLKENEENFKSEIQKRDEQLLQQNVDVDITKGLSGLKLNEDLPESVRRAMINQVKNNLVKSAQVIDGKVVYHDEDGKPIRNKQYQPADAEYLLKEQLKDILATDKKPGGGAPPSGTGEVITTGTGDSTTMKLVLDKGSFSTKQEFLTQAEKALQDKGISRTDKDYNKLIDEANKEYGVSELPRN